MNGSFFFATLSYIMMKNGQTYFSNLEVCTLQVLELCSTIFTLCIIGLMSPNFFHIFFPHMFRNKLYLDKKHRITKFCYWATKISLKCFFRKLFLKRLLSRNAKKYLLQLAKIPKTNRSWSERYVLNLF